MSTKRTIFLVILFAFPGLLSAFPHSFTVPFRCIEKEELKILITAHFYGSSNARSGFPASTVLGNISWINQSGADLILHQGDLFPSLDTLVLSNYRKALFNQLEIPLLNVPGNHDKMLGDYSALAGPSFGTFDCGRVRFILLDTELNDGSIKGEQLKLLQSALADVSGYHIIISSHRTIWTAGYEELNDLFSDNTRSALGNNFNADVKPLIEAAAQKNKVYWLSGSMGSARSSFFHHKAGGVDYIISAVRDEPRDGMLMLTLGDNKATFETYSLTGRPVDELNTYNVSYHQEGSGRSSFNPRLIPLYLKQGLTGIWFWAGLFFGVAGMIFINRRRKSRRTV